MEVELEFKYKSKSSLVEKKMICIKNIFRWEKIFC